MARTSSKNSGPDQSLIEARAYELFVARGGDHGADVDDWLEAERQVHAETAPAKRPRAARAPSGQSRPGRRAAD